MKIPSVLAAGLALILGAAVTTAEESVVPGLKGFGVETAAGRGGQIVRVTSLSESGPGSFREALEATGPRIIVFEVGGVIDLDKRDLVLKEPFVTIAGQTAPSPGITVIRGGFRIEAHDVLMQHMRFRSGDAGLKAPEKGYEPDVTTSGANAYNIVIDHCSFSWAVDENLSISGPRLKGYDATSRRVTLSNNIIAEGLAHSVHEKGLHSMGTLVHDYVSDVAVIGNVYAHNNERNPWFKGFATGVIVNNVIYDPGTWAIRLGPVFKEWESAGIVPEPPRVAIVGNYMKAGASTRPGLAMIGSNSSGLAYIEDNISIDAAGSPGVEVGGKVERLDKKPVWPEGLVAKPASEVLEAVTRDAGARPRERDTVDTRIIADVLVGTGRLINSQEQVGGYPRMETTRRALEIPAPEKIEAWLNSLADVLETGASDK